MKYRSCWLIFTLRSKFGSHCLIIWKNDTHASNSVTQTYIYFEVKHRVILTHNGSYWPIIPKYDAHTSNSLQDVTQNHWTMKYRSQWTTLYLRSNIGSYWFIIPNKDVHTSNNLQDIRPNHWTMKHRSQWPVFIFRSKLGHTDSYSQSMMMYIHQIVFKI